MLCTLENASNCEQLLTYSTSKLVHDNCQHSTRHNIVQSTRFTANGFICTAAVQHNADVYTLHWAHLAYGIWSTVLTATWSCLYKISGQLHECHSADKLVNIYIQIIQLFISMQNTCSKIIFTTFIKLNDHWPACVKYLSVWNDI